MSDIVRQEIAATADTIVVKVGTRVLTHADGTLDHGQIARLGEELGQLIELGRKVVLVSSGSVGAGMSQLGLVERPEDWAFSSYRDYVGLREGTLPVTDVVLGQFSSCGAYRAFVEDYDKEDVKTIGHLVIDEA